MRENKPSSGKPGSKGPTNNTGNAEKARQGISLSSYQYSHDESFT